MTTPPFLSLANIRQSGFPNEFDSPCVKWAKIALDTIALFSAAAGAFFALKHSPFQRSAPLIALSIASLALACFISKKAPAKPTEPPKDLRSQTRAIKPLNMNTLDHKTLILEIFLCGLLLFFVDGRLR